MREIANFMKIALVYLRRDLYCITWQQLQGWGFHGDPVIRYATAMKYYVPNIVYLTQRHERLMLQREVDIDKP
jgi:hypothetical protein